jgi:hypothetical protein
MKSILSILSTPKEWYLVYHTRAQQYWTDPSGMTPDITKAKRYRDKEIDHIVNMYPILEKIAVE